MSFPAEASSERVSDGGKEDMIFLLPFILACYHSRFFGPSCINETTGKRYKKLEEAVVVTTVHQLRLPKPSSQTPLNIYPFFFFFHFLNVSESLGFL